jgi:hypothetical protein
MWLAGTWQVLCAVVAIEGNSGRAARRWRQTRAPGPPARARNPGRVALDAQPGRVAPGLFPGKRDYTVLAPLRSRSGGNRFLGLRQASPLPRAARVAGYPALPGRLSRPATW